MSFFLDKFIITFNNCVVAPFFYHNAHQLASFGISAKKLCRSSKTSSSSFSFHFPGDYLDILAISCDSFDEATNQLIGRAQGRKSHLDNLYKIRNWCQQYKVAFKINSVINTFNVDEDMTENITSVNPVRWKVRMEKCVV